MRPGIKLLAVCCVSWIFLAGCGETKTTNEQPKVTEAKKEVQANTTSKKFVVVSDPWFPYAGKEGKSEQHGFIVETAEIIFTKAGYDVEYKTLPWERCLSEVKSGKYQAVASADKNEAPYLIAPEETSGTFTDALFVLKGKEFTYESPESLNDKRFLCIDGYEYGEELSKYISEKRKNVTLLSGDEPLENMIKIVKSGRADVFVDELNVTVTKLKQMGILDKFSIIPLNGSSGDLYLLFSPKTEKGKEYAKIFTEGIRDMRKSGELQKILDKYGILDWKK